MNVLVLEDDNIAFDMARDLLEGYGYKNIDHSPSLIKAIPFLEQNNYDLVLLDIHLEDGKSVDLMDYIPSTTQIIFVTSDASYAVEAFEMNAVDYLVKPIKEDRFAKAMNKLKEESVERTIIVKADYLYHKVKVKSILFVKSTRDYLTLFLENKQLTFYGRIKSFVKKLPENSFVQCHRSYVVNLIKVKTFSNNVLLVGDEFEVPVSVSRKKEILVRLEELK